MAAALRICSIALLAVASCRSPRPRTEPPPEQQTGGPRPGATPRSRADLPTTSGDLALSNLTSQIEGLERALGPNGRDVATRTSLVSLLLLRGQLQGRIADYERADKLAGEVVAGAPRSAAAYQ